MPHLGTLLCIAITIGGCASRNYATAPGSERSTGAGETLDFARIRSDYGERDDFFDLCERNRPLEQLAELANEERWQEVLQISRPWLARCPVDIEVQFVTAVALKELRRDLEAEEHVRWYRGLVESILASGDGRSPETAYQVISIAEEYSILRVFKVDFKFQSLVEDKIDALAVWDESGEHVIYFNPAAHFRRLERALAED